MIRGTNPFLLYKKNIYQSTIPGTPNVRPQPNHSQNSMIRISIMKLMTDPSNGSRTRVIHITPILSIKMFEMEASTTKQEDHVRDDDNGDLSVVYSCRICVPSKCRHPLQVAAAERPSECIQSQGSSWKQWTAVDRRDAPVYGRYLQRQRVLRLCSLSTSPVT